MREEFARYLGSHINGKTGGETTVTSPECLSTL